MYIPKVFRQNDIDDLENIIVKYPFASLVTYSEVGVEVNHLPLFLDKSKDKSVLQGHIAKANPLWKNMANNTNLFVIFNGPNCYISPNYYPTKHQTGRSVPTWNYVAVHVKGLISYRFDDAFKLEMLNNLTFQHEQHQENAWSINDAPTEYIQRMLPAIVGFEIQILTMVGQYKVSQNQPDINKKGVVEGLLKIQNNDAAEIAVLVQDHVNI